MKNVPPALKHAAYSSMAFLPGEDPAEFEKLHKDLISDLAPDGPLEEDVVATIARLLWRKQNLQSFRIAQHAKERFETIRHPGGTISATSVMSLVEAGYDPEKDKATRKLAEEQARKELGSTTYELIEIGATSTVEEMLKELDVHDRLDAMIGGCLKQLLHVRGLKSMSIASSNAPAGRVTGNKLLAGPGARNGGTARPKD
jgi:hypothetical protein